MKTFLRHALFLGWHAAQRDGVNRAIRELDENQWRSTKDLLAMQEEKLYRLLTHATRNVPYYRDLFRKFGFEASNALCPRDWAQIPPLKKRTINQEREALISRDLVGNGLINNSTSGSTGEALRFCIDLRSKPQRTAGVWRSDSWTGWRLGERVVRLWGATIDQEKTVELRGRLHGLVTGDKFLSSFDLSPSRMDEYASTILRFKPTLLIAYPGPLERFAIHCRERRVTFPSLRGIVSSAETLWPHQRQVIESTFSVPIFNRYGSREVAQIASECEARDGLHISVERLLVEVVDDDNRPCPPGQAGRVLVTDLDNFGMPMIRYEIGDRGALAAEAPCACGRGLPRMEKVEGRTMDIVRTRSGNQIGGTFWTLLLRSRPGIKQFQVVQDDLDGVVIYFVRDADLERTTFDYFESRIKEYCGSDFRVEFIEKPAIRPTASGKHRLIVSNLPGPEVTKSAPN